MPKIIFEPSTSAMSLHNKLIYSFHAFVAFGILAIGCAIFFGFRGDTFTQARANLQADYEKATVQAKYTSQFNNTNNKEMATMLPNVFYNYGSRYSIRYPESWQYADAVKGVLLLNGKSGTPEHYSNINIQTVRTQQFGGKFSTVDQFIAYLKKQTTAESSNVRFLESGNIALPQLDGTEVKGQYFVYTYSVYGMAFKQWWVVVLRNDTKVFYAFTYSSPLVQYQDGLGTAKAMLKSWNIY